MTSSKMIIRLKIFFPFVTVLFLLPIYTYFPEIDINFHSFAPIQPAASLVHAEILDNTETKTKVVVEEFYKLILKREPEPQGLTGWSGSILSGRNTPSMAAWKIFASTEFKQKFLPAGKTIISINDSEYVDLLYKVILKRVPDPAGKTWHLKSLTSGTSRVVLFERFLTSRESRQLHKIMFATGLFDSAPVVVEKNLTGYFDGLHPISTTQLYGWAADTNAPLSNLIVEIAHSPTSDYRLAKIAARVTANIESPDVLIRRGITGNHRFLWSIPTSFFGTSHYWFIHIVNEDGTKVALGKSPQKISLKAPAAPVCVVDGETVQSGETATFYKTAAVGSTDRCSFYAQQRTCSIQGTLSGDPIYSKSNCTETIMDYNQSLVPTTEPKLLGVFNDVRFGEGTGRLLSYWKEGNIIKTSYDVLEGTIATRRALFHTVPFRIGNWQGNPSLVSANAKVTTTNNTVSLAVAGPTTNTTALSFSFDGKKTTIRARAIEQAVAVLGGVFFASKADLPEPGSGLGRPAGVQLLTTPRFKEKIFLTDYTKLMLKIDATLTSFVTNTGCVPGTPTTNRAQNCYDKNLHANQFRPAFGNMTWTDPRCTKRDVSDPICRYYGDWLYFTMMMFDERYEYGSNNFIQDRYTGSWIYQLSLRDLLPGRPSQNPFKIVGKRTVAQGDILPTMKNAVLAAEAKGYLPPRLNVGSRVENDQEYLSHYSFIDTNIGFENTTLSDITFDLHDFTLVGTRSSTARKPSCDLVVTPNIITRGQTATLTWKASLANSMRLNTGTISKLSSGSVIVKPTESTAYNATAVNESGSNTCATVLIVK